MHLSELMKFMINYVVILKYFTFEDLIVS